MDAGRFGKGRDIHEEREGTPRAPLAARYLAIVFPPTVSLEVLGGVRVRRGSRGLSGGG